jgi:TatD DNase family protein
LLGRCAPIGCATGAAPALDWLLHELNHPKVVAIGETGLDYHYEPEAAELQQASFRLHLQAARQTGKPVIIHTRGARADTLELLREAALPQAGVLHCFTEDWDMAKAALDMGYYISLSGIVTFRNADALRDVASKVPTDRLLVETDSPYLAPIPYRGKPNLPQYVREVAEFLAMLRGEDYERFAEQTTENFKRCFLGACFRWLCQICHAGHRHRAKNPGSGGESGLRPLGVKQRHAVPWYLYRHGRRCRPTVQVLISLAFSPVERSGF